MFLSTHQSPWYPGTGSKEETGKGKGLGYTLNFPFPAGSGRNEIVEGAFGRRLPRRFHFFPNLQGMESSGCIPVLFLCQFPLCFRFPDTTGIGEYLGT